MIAKAKKVIGLPVYSVNTGEESGKVKDIIYDPYQNKIAALLLDEEGLFSDERVLMYEDIESIGEDAVITESKELIRKIKEISQDIRNIIDGNTNLTGHRIITDEGKELGKATDILFDTASGEVREFEVTGNRFEVLSSGKKTVPIRGIKTIGKDAVIVDELTEHIVEEQAQHQGAQGAINRTREKVEQAGDDVQAALEDARDKLQQSAHDVKEDPRTKDTIDKGKSSLQNLRHQVEEKMDEMQDRVDETKDRQDTRDVTDAIDQKWYEARQTLQGRLGGLKQYTQETAEKKRRREREASEDDERVEVTIQRRE